MKKKEQKQHLIDMMKSDEELGLYDESQEIKLEEVFNDEKKENIKKFIDEINNPSEPNKALKDAAERISKEHYVDQSDYWAVGVDSFKRGAKWQQERSYSEEEVINIAKQAFVLGKDFGLIGTFNEWFEQFKKK